MTDEEKELVYGVAERWPKVPAIEALSAPLYEHVCEKVLCYSVTPLRVVAERLRELTETPS